MRQLIEPELENYIPLSWGTWTQGIVETPLSTVQNGKKNLTLCKRYQCWDCGNPMKQCASISCLWKKCSKCRKRNYLIVTICTSLVSNGGDKITREIFNKELCQRNLPRLSIKLTTPNQMMSYAVYISHILRSRQWSYQTPGGPSAKGRWELWVASKTMQIAAQRPTD